MAQFYYKDLLVNQETAHRWKLYRDNRVKAVALSSTEADGKPTEGFLGEQEVSADFSRITTHTKTSGTADSWIITDYNPQGRILKNTDTSDTYQNVSEYRYDDQGRINSISDTSLETDNHFREVEVHSWSYSPVHPDRPLSMLKIRDGSDTTYVRFVLDDKGNVTEEHARRKGENMPVIYYYYDDSSHLTDIVRYSARAKRLLPMDMFEYEDGNLSSSLIVPEEGNSFYQKWYYVYDDKGLKAKDFCYNKEKELLGSIEYHYSYK
jgi:YD repeat-containing protein